MTDIQQLEHVAKKTSGTAIAHEGNRYRGFMFDGSGDHTDLSVLVAGGAMITGGNWTRVVFHVESGAALQFNRATLRSCELRSHEDGSLKLLKVADDSHLDDLKFNVKVADLVVQGSVLSGCTLPDELERGDFKESSIRDCVAKGRVTELRVNEVDIRDGTWRVGIRRVATLSMVTFEGTNLDIDSLKAARGDLSTVSVEGAKIQDRWADLRANYTGPRLFIVLLLTLVFFAPYSARAAFHVLLGRTAPGLLVDQEVPLWSVLLFGNHDGWAKIWYCCVTSLLLLYSSGRLFITLRLSMLRERQEHMASMGFASYRPPSKDLDWYWRVHKALSWLFWISILSGAWRASEVLFTLVPIL